MHYRIAVTTDLPGKGMVRAWYAGRQTGTPRFEMEASHSAVLRYEYFENARDDKTFLERLSTLCHDVEIVTFDETDQMDESMSDLPGSATIVHLEESSSALEALVDVQNILTQVIRSKMYADKPEQAQEQTRSALSLVLKAISILRRQQHARLNKD